MPAPRPRQRPRLVMATARPAAPRATRKSDTVADDVLRRIVAGELAVGSLLPREAELAASYHVNRNVVREAIKLLEVHGLVRPVRRRGTEVLDPLATLSPRVVGAMLVPRPGRVDRAALESFLEIRVELDVLMTRRAAERRSRQDLAALEAGLVKLRAALKDPEAYARQVSALGLVVAAASGNPLFSMLASWHASVTDDLAPIFAVVRPASEAHVEGMALLVRLIREQDADGAGDLVRRFHQWSTPRLLKAAELGAAPRSTSFLKENMA